MKTVLMILFLSLTSSTFASDISCLGDLEDGFNLNWCVFQEEAGHKTCEKAAVEGLKGYFGMKFIEANGLRVIEVVEEDETYKVGFGIGQADILYWKHVLVSNSPKTCFAVEIY